MNLEQIYQRHADFVWRTLRRLGVPDAEARDAVHDVFLIVHAHLSRFEGRSSLSTWLFAICRNTFLRVRHRERRVLAVDDPETEVRATTQLYWDAVGSGLDDVFDRVDLRPALERSLGAMLPEYAETVMLVDVEGFSYADAASELGVPVGTVRSRLFRARRLLQEALIDYARDLALEAEIPAHVAPLRAIDAVVWKYQKDSHSHLRA